MVYTQNFVIWKRFQIGAKILVTYKAVIWYQRCIHFHNMTLPHYNVFVFYSWKMLFFFAGITWIHLWTMNLIRIIKRELNAIEGKNAPLALQRICVHKLVFSFQPEVKKIAVWTWKLSNPQSRKVILRIMWLYLKSGYLTFYSNK